MIIFVIIIFGLLLTNLNNTQTTKQVYSYSTLITQISKNEVKQIDIQPNTDNPLAGKAKVTLKDSTVATVNILSINEFTKMVDGAVLANGSDVTINTVEAAKTSFLWQFVPTLVVMVISVLILMFIIQQMQGGGGGGNRVMSFGKSKAKIMTDDKKKVTFENVAGLDEEKAELAEVVDFLKFPKKYVDLGARIPKGILLFGPPGTGKTLLAKAVAGEAGVPFFSISGSDFVEMFVGVGASRVRDLFEQAKKSSPCIVFIDEIDAVGRKRGAGLGGGHDEREQTLNQLLVEMDGFGANEGIIIIAATNRPDILDPALLRPGRFDREVVVGRPDVKGREEILKVHAKGKPLADDVDLRVVSQTTSGFTGADLENLLNEAALLTARENKKKIDMEEVRKAFVKVGIGTEKKSRVVSEKEKRNTAYHEAGHAIIFEVLSELDPVHSVSIIPTGRAAGYTMPLPGEDKMSLSKTFMKQEIVGLLGGRAAEFIILNEITTGASNDIERATATARSMVMKYGMSDALGPIQFGDDNDEVFIGRDLAHTRNYGEEVASLIDKEIKNIIETSYEQAKKIVEENLDSIHATVELLIQKEKITGEEFRDILSKFSPQIQLKTKTAETQENIATEL